MPIRDLNNLPRVVITHAASLEDLVTAAAKTAEDCIQGGHAQKQKGNFSILPESASYNNVKDNLVKNHVPKILEGFLPGPLNLQQIERVKPEIFAYQQGTFQWRTFSILVLVPLRGPATMEIRPREPDKQAVPIDWKPGDIITIYGPCDHNVKTGEVALLAIGYKMGNS